MLQFQCCGLNNLTDWNSNDVYSCANSKSQLSCHVPDSCCKEQSEVCLVIIEIDKQLMSRQHIPEI